jgi:hypothetical protein
VSRPRRWPGTAPVLAGRGGGDDTLGPLVWRAPHEEVYADAFMAVADELAEGPAFPPPAWWRDQASCLGPLPADRWRERAGSWAMRVLCGMAWCVPLGWALGVFAETPLKVVRKSCARVRLPSSARPPTTIRHTTRSATVDGNVLSWVCPQAVGSANPRSVNGSRKLISYRPRPVRFRVPSTRSRPAAGSWVRGHRSEASAAGR